jgi:hypothetical protein
MQKFNKSGVNMIVKYVNNLKEIYFGYFLIENLTDQKSKEQRTQLPAFLN